MVAYRELGYDAKMTFAGEPFILDQGSELAIYKIVFEALENVRKHTSRGTTVTVDFTWVTPGLQVMIKDNGIEHVNRSKAQLGEIIEGYTIEDDAAALVQEIDGSTLSVLRERAALYEGSVEAMLEPGIGFTVAAIFPNLKTVVEGK
jgi:signal transduction histidine kinase